MNRPQSVSFSVLAASAALLFLCSCSAFQSSRKMDMSPFSQNAVTMFAEAAKISVPYQFKELKKYQTLPDLVELRSKAVPFFQVLKGLVMYSNQLVALNNARMKDSEKNQRLADYLVVVRRRSVDTKTMEDLGVQMSGLDSVIDNIRSAPTFLEGIDAAAPLVDAIVFAMSTRLEEFSSMVPGLVAGFEERIEADQTQQKENMLELRRLQAVFHRAATLLYRAKMGEPQMLDTLLAVDPSLREYFNTKGGVSGKNWQDAEDALTLRLERIDGFMTQLASEARIYRAKQQELGEWRIQLEEKIKIGRDAIMVWAQSHHNLGKGIPVPPLIDVTGIAGGLAKKALPIP